MVAVNFPIFQFKQKKKKKRRRKRFKIHLLTKMSDITRRFEAILTSFSSDKCNGQVQVKLDGCLYGQPR